MARTPDTETRERILDAAGTLFDEHGVRSVGIARIIEEAGCGRSLLYRHFPSKDALVLAWLERFAAMRDRSTAQVVAGLERVPSATLVALAREVADRVSDPAFRGCALRNYLREVRGPDEPATFAMAQVAASRRRLDDLVARLGTEEPDALAGRIWLVLEGLYASVVYPDRDRAATDAVGLVQDLLANA